MTMYSAKSPADGIVSNDTPLEVPMDDQEDDQEGMEAEWLSMATDAYEQSTDYFESSIRGRQDNAMAHFNNEHVPGSKYGTESYKYRSRGFRPKSRAVVRKNEAACAKAFFSTQDAVTIKAKDQSDAKQVIAAELVNEVVNYRLETDIKWFPTLVGAYQDTLVAGVCISYQSWEYQEVTSAVDPQTTMVNEGWEFQDEESQPQPQQPQMQGQPQPQMQGQPQPQQPNPQQPEIQDTSLDMGLVPDTLMDDGSETDEFEIIRDHPSVELRPVENVRFSTGADWTDPINTSPFLIDKIAMYVGDVKAKQSKGWYALDDTDLLIGSTEYADSVRSQREKGREDSKDQSYQVTDFDTVWVHRNIMRRDGRDWIYYTLGVHLMLSEPKLLVEEYPHLREGQRPYVMGNSVLETHKTYPSSLVTLTEGLQQEANDISNQRRDNVALVLNKRYYVRRGSGVDYRALTRNVPGSVTLMNDIQQDIRTESPPEVTQSSYQEQDRVNMDYDELAGSFSTSSVGSNRSLNETVGGMDMMKGDSNDMVEYQIRLFTETWVEQVIRQLIQLEQAYENDEAVLNIAGRRAETWERYGVDEITDDMLQGSMTTEIRVGYGATNPQKQVERLTMGIRTIAEFNPQVVQQMDGAEVVKEIMGSLGYKGSDRFFPKLKEEQPDPEVQQLQQQVQQLTQQLQSQMEGKKLDSQTKIQIEDMRGKAARDVEQIRMQSKAQGDQVKAQVEGQKAQIKAQIDHLNAQIKQAASEVERGKLINARDALLWKIELDAAQLKQSNRLGKLKLASSTTTPNPDNRQSTVISNDKYGSIPGQRG